ncbi:hypothetical protein AB434_3904 [Heyndrickxia coagulans]|uniref:Uncharacterized protein n=1 Tax=Heyndrickxia coagulans TaxID=1398 RepID=A0AAN0T3H2_HEYCO|nr:hypothetical protein SB48_HM08orf02135 [Heyndrickxia coagulans]AKN56309.1 hypothetical protein AB434_3904 [Heyndrickxia coagulans]
MVPIQNITGTWLFHVIPKSDNIGAATNSCLFQSHMNLTGFWIMQSTPFFMPFKKR